MRVIEENDDGARAWIDGWFAPTEDGSVPQLDDALALSSDPWGPSHRLSGATTRTSRHPAVLTLPGHFNANALRTAQT